MPESPSELLRLPVCHGYDVRHAPTKTIVIDEADGQPQVSRLRAFLRRHGATTDLGREPQENEISQALVSILQLHELNLRDWERERHAEKTAGCVTEISLPDGARILVADARTLARCPDTCASQEQAESDSDGLTLQPSP